MKNDYKLDRKYFSVLDLSEKQNDKEYWLSKSPVERLEALEFLRQIMYGYDPTTERLQRFFEVVERKKIK
ncbi:MAG: hypothetical protein N3A61_07710 [Ignavibacteria bacterium]|nr:hypothetical protein [Ignavibacteria bacterium]